jgi:hypothetical protein
MRKILILLPSLLIASPALAQAAPPAKAPLQVPPQLTDPAIAERLGNAMQAMTQTFLDLRVGGLQAALEGRPATPAEKRRTVRDVARSDGVDVQRQIAQARPMVERSVRAMQQALPEVLDDLSRASDALDRATANLPDPTYPKR